MASIGSNEMPIGSTFFEIPIDLSNDEPKEQTSIETPKGGLSFSVGLDDNQV